MPSFADDGSRIRITIFSPNSVGNVETRKSIVRCADNTSLIRPSCGIRFSEMSSFEITLIRDASVSLISSGGFETSRSSPSIR